MKEFRRVLLDAGILLVWIFFSGLHIGAFTGFPKGLDAYQHLGMIKFVLNNWPNVRWYPYWYGGTPFYLWYAPLPHHLTAFIAKISGLPIESLVIFLSAVSFSLIILGLYALVYCVTKDHTASLIISLIISSSPIWGFLVGGGAYARIISAAFLPFATWFAIMYTRNQEIGNKSRKYYVGTVFLVTAALISHLQGGAITSLIVMLILIFCIEQNKKKMLHVLKVFIPVVFLSAFFILPFLASGPRQFAGEIHTWNVPVPLLDLLLTYPGNWNTVSPLILPIVIIGLLILRQRKLDLDEFKVKVLKALGTMAVLLFIYTFTRIPPQLYLFSPYDAPFYLNLFIAAGAGIFLNCIFVNYGKTNKRKMVTAFLLTTVAVASVAQLVILQSFVINTGAESWYSGYYVMQNLIKINASDDNYRFGSDWDGASTWFNYWYNVPQTRGFYQLGIIYPKWYNWLEDSVWKQNDNYEETNFLLDWYAVKPFAVGWPNYNYEKFLNRPKLYDVVSKIDTPTLYTMYEFEYKFATPIASASNTTTMLVIGSDEEYESMLHALAQANLNSNYILPVKGQSYVDDYYSDQLKEFDTIFVALGSSYYRNFSQTWALLDAYVKGGGGLIIDTLDSELPYIPEPSPVSKTKIMEVEEKNWNLSVVEHEITSWINFMLFSHPSAMPYSYAPVESIRQGAKEILSDYSYPVVVITERGAGRVVWSGLSLPRRISSSKNYIEAAFLFRMIKWASKSPQNEKPFLVTSVDSMNNWSVTWATSNAQGHITLDDSTKKIGSNAIKLLYEFRDTINRNQVNYIYNPPASWNWTKADFFSLWIFSDGSDNEVTIYLERTDFRDSFWFTLPLDWKGWRQITYQFNQMNTDGFVDKSVIDKIEIIITGAPSEKITSSFINVDGMYVGERYEPELQPISVAERSNSERVETEIKQAAKGVLFKENYFYQWHAYMLSDNGTKIILKINRVGPDFMYVFIPNNVKFPVKITFEYETSQIETVSSIVSLLTFVTLIVYGLWARLNKLGKFVGILPKKILISKKKRHPSEVSVREKINPFDIVTSDYKLKLRRDLEELQTDLAKATSASAFCWIKKGNITKELAADSKRVLDLGCGWGRELVRLRNAVGIDISLPFLRAAKNYTHNDVILASINFLPFKEDAFDLLVMSEVIEHLENQEGAMNEAVRVLQNKGKIVLQTPNRQITRQKVVAERYGHVHEFDPKELFKFLANFRFQVLKRLGSTIPYMPSDNSLSVFNENLFFFKLWKLLDRLCPLKWDIIISAKLLKTRNTVSAS